MIKIKFVNFAVLTKRLLLEDEIVLCFYFYF